MEKRKEILVRWDGCACTHAVEHWVPAPLTVTIAGWDGNIVCLGDVELTGKWINPRLYILMRQNPNWDGNLVCFGDVELTGKGDSVQDVCTNCRGTYLIFVKDEREV